MAKKQRVKVVEQEEGSDLPPMENKLQTRTSYPQQFPMGALEMLKQIGQKRSWTEEKSALCHCLWEIEGAAAKIWIGDPLAKPSIEAAPIDPEFLAQQLYEAREIAFKGIGAMRSPPAAGKPMLNSDDVRACVMFLENAIRSLAWLRKCAQDAATAQRGVA